jgi:hypothetical protein
MSGLKRIENYLPLIFFQLYLLGTVLLFAFGPWQWIIADNMKLFGFLLASQLMIAVGYVLAVWREGPWQRRVTEPRSGILLFRLSLAVNIVLAAPTAWARSNSWVPNIVAGLQNPGIVYMESVDRLMVFGPHVYVEYARILLAVVILPMVPLTIIYWRSLSRIERFLAGATIAWYLSIFIAVGQNKGLADAIATWAILIIAGIIFRRLPLRSLLIKLPIAYAVSLVLFFSYFGMTQLLRHGGAVANDPGTLTWYAPVESTEPVAETADDAGDGRGLHVGTGPTSIVAYPDHLVARIAPDFVRNAYESFARYLGQGYQALAFSIDYAHPSTLGVGNSMFLSRNVDRVLKTDFFESQSLPGILERETGWSRQMQWHSIYTWLASDVGLAGTLLVMGVLGFVLAKSWVRTIRTAEPVWATMLYMMLIIFFYIPANNQIMQSGETAIGFIALSLLIFVRWVISRFSGAAIWRVK